MNRVSNLKFQLFTKKAKDIHPIMYVIGILFLLRIVSTL